MSSLVNEPTHCLSLIKTIDKPIVDIISKFLELEEVQSLLPLSAEDIKCEQLSPHEGASNRLESATFSKDIYVNDTVTSAPTLSEALNRQARNHSLARQRRVPVE